MPKKFETYTLKAYGNPYPNNNNEEDYTIATIIFTNLQTANAEAMKIIKHKHNNQALNTSTSVLIEGEKYYNDEDGWQFSFCREYNRYKYPKPKIEIHTYNNKELYIKNQENKGIIL
jgi:hypothetical protein